MPKKLQITKSFTRESFARIEAAFRKHFALPLETVNARGLPVDAMCSNNCHPLFCRLVRASPTGLRRCRQDRIRSLNIAIETGQPYINFCHAGIILVCVPIMEHDTSLGGLLFGKCLWDGPTDALVEDIFKRLKGLRVNKPRLKDAIAALPVIPGRKTHEAAEFLYVLLYEVTGLDPRVIRWRRQRSLQQSRIGELIQEKKKLGADNRYPLDSERELIGKVKIGDRTGAREILNSILGTILFHNPGDLSVLKARLLELLSIISRAAVEGGVDINLLLEKNLDYINKVMRINNQQDLCVWISHALDNFIELVYSSQNGTRVNKLKPAIEYINAHYDQPVTLADVARAAHLSVSRLSHLFKQLTGATVIEHLTSVRIEHAKRLLLTTDKSCTQICFQIGYNHQSYFTRSFRRLTGLTPRQFRTCNLRAPAERPAFQQ